MPAPYPPPPKVDKLVKLVAIIICEDNFGRDAFQLEPGDAYAVDAVLDNGDPAHMLWRQHVETAETVLAAVRRHKKRL